MPVIGRISQKTAFIEGPRDAGAQLVSRHRPAIDEQNAGGRDIVAPGTVISHKKKTGDIAIYRAGLKSDTQIENALQEFRLIPKPGKEPPE